MKLSRTTHVSLVLPCYNEETIFEDSVSRIVGTLSRSKLTYEILFVDDGSRDRTVGLIRKACRHHPFCRAIFHEKNYGRGRSVRDGIKEAKGWVVGYIDIDLEVTPVYIPEMVSLILKNKADVVIGKRVYRTSFSSFPREIMSRGYRLLADLVVGTGSLDTETGYKFFNRRKILPALAKAHHPHWFWDTEIMVWAKQKGLNIIEVPVLFLRRTDKQSSVRVIPDMLDYLVSLWRLARRLG